MKTYEGASEIKGAVIGYSQAFRMGKSHLEQMRAAGMVPTAVVEKDPELLKKAEEEFPGIETYRTVGTMLKKSEANLIGILTPHNTHAKLALQCLRAGRHVVCEKPFAIKTSECDAMIGEARKQGLMVSTYHNRHWDGCILEAVDRVKNKKTVGEVYKIEINIGAYSRPREWWRSSRSISGGALYDWGVHVLEYALQIIDENIEEVTGCAKEGFWAADSVWGEDTVEDEAFLAVRFANGKWLTLCKSSLDMVPDRKWISMVGTMSREDLHSVSHLPFAKRTARKAS
ncbi:MAG: Gfo/Idh/MocA family oxidoreductase, partial [Kiritimatiellia bacterium]